MGSFGVLGAVGLMGFRASQVPRTPANGHPEPDLIPLRSALPSPTLIPGHFQVGSYRHRSLIEGLYTL